MTTASRTKNQTYFGAFSKYVRNKEQHQRNTFRINPDGSTVWLINGGEMPDEVFKEMYPIGLINRTGATHLDSRQHIY